MESKSFTILHRTVGRIRMFFLIQTIPIGESLDSTLFDGKLILLRHR